MGIQQRMELNFRQWAVLKWTDGCNRKWESISAEDAHKRRTISRSTWSAATCRRFLFWAPGHSGDESDKSPHSKGAPIAHLHFRKAALEVTPTSNRTLDWGVIRSGSQAAAPERPRKLYFKPVTSKWQ